jgi:hypothetical protein
MIGGAIIIALSFALWGQIDRNASLRAKLGACNATITTSEDFNAAISNPDSLPWLERLLRAESNAN